MKYSRREFISSTLGCMAAMGIGGGKKIPKGHPSAPTQGTTLKDGVLHRELGKTGVILPIVGMGVMNARDPALVRKAYETGMRHFDTAFNYGQGRNEEMIGQVVRDMGVRDRVVIATKVLVPELRRGLGAAELEQKFVRAVETSLHFLKMDMVDIIYVHDVHSVEDVALPGVQEAIARLKKDGKVRFGGFTTHRNMADCLDEAVKVGFYDVVLTSYNVSLADDQRLLEALRNAHAKGIGLVAMKTQCNQYWYQQNLPEDQRGYYQGDKLNSAFLKWVMQHPFIATSVPGVTTYQHIEDDFSVARNLAYTPEEAKFLKDRSIQASLGVCRQCGQCLSTCPKKADIPALMRSHMYSFCYHNREQAAETLKSLPRGRGIGACSSCKTCRARCSYSLDLSGRIADLLTTLV